MELFLQLFLTISGLFAGPRRGGSQDTQPRRRCLAHAVPSALRFKHHCPWSRFFPGWVPIQSWGDKPLAFLVDLSRGLACSDGGASEKHLLCVYTIPGISQCPVVGSREPRPRTLLRSRYAQALREAAHPRSIETKGRPACECQQRLELLMSAAVSCSVLMRRIHHILSDTSELPLQELASSQRARAACES